MKIDLITGLLGSGKTTFIKKYASFLKKTNKICILENDYGAVNVDMLILKDIIDDNLNIEMISGGCDKESHIRRFKTKLIQLKMQGYERIIIEPSGIFDPEELFDILNEEPLNEWYEIGSIITIVDSTTLTIDKSLEYYMVSQIAPCGIIYFNKSHIENLDIIKNNINDILLKYNCKKELNIITTPLNELTDKDFVMFMNAKYKYSIFDHDIPSSSFSSFYLWEYKKDKEKLFYKLKNIFMHSEIGQIIRIKGYIKENNSFIEINATKQEFEVNYVKEGQEVIIFIGKDLDNFKIEEYIKNDD